MSYPAIRSSVSTTAMSALGTSHTVNLPATISAGDYILVLFSVSRAANSTTRGLTWPGGWTVIASTTAGGEVQAGAAYKLADGTEDGTSITVTSSNTGRSSYAAYAISGAAAAPSATIALASSGDVDPPSHTHTFGTAEYMTFILTCAAGIATTAVPSGYASTGIENYGASEMSAMTAQGTTASATENPGVITYTGTPGRRAAITAMVPGLLLLGNNMFFGSNF